MAIPYFDMGVVSRGRGGSAAASAAYGSGTKVTSAVGSASYRSGEALHDKGHNITFDYTRKEDVIHTEIIAPESAPAWTGDRETLWNAVEASEKRKDAQLARTLIAALPRELSYEQNIAMVREYVADHFVTKGMVADVAIHDKDASDGDRNPHVHVMFTLREVDENGLAPTKNREWNLKHQLYAWREGWETVQNRHLEAAGVDVSISMESYKARGINKLPEVHLGHADWRDEQAGIETGRGNQNREARQKNAVTEAVDQWQPEYTGEDEAAYYEKLQGEWVQVDEPNLEYMAVRGEQMARQEKAAMLLDKYYARVTQQTDTTWLGLGSKTTRTQFPSMPSVSRAMHDASASPEKIQADWAMQRQPGLERRDTQDRHRGVVSSFLHSDHSGATAEGIEQFQRTMKNITDKVQEIGHSILDRYTDWTQRQPQPDRERERGRGYERD